VAADQALGPGLAKTAVAVPKATAVRLGEFGLADPGLQVGAGLLLVPRGAVAAAEPDAGGQDAGLGVRVGPTGRKAGSARR
jgi:hypothetical protein